MKMKVSHRDFVVAYASSRTLDDVIKNTGMTKAAIWGRVKALREKGVRFPKLDQTPMLDELEIAQLNSLIKKYDIRKK
jgi:biotin operon repressor